MTRPLKPYRLSGGDREVPTEFRIFAYGKVPTLKGDFVFTREDCAELLADRDMQNAEVEIDYEHQTYDDTPGPKPAAGWCQLEARDDGLWAVNVRWTDTASKLLQAGEYRYFSPTFRAHSGTKEILQLANLALTNIPAMRKITPLVAASTVKGSKTPYQLKEKTMPAMHKLAGFLQKHMSENTIEPHTLAEKCGMDIDRFRKLAAGEAPTPEEMTRCAKALSMSEEDLKSMSVDSRKAGDMETPNESDPDDVSTETTETTTHEPADEDREDHVPTSSRNTPPDALDLVQLTGTRDPKKQMTFLRGLAQAAAVNVQLRDEVVSLRNESNKQKREMLVKAGKEKGQLTPALIKLFDKKPVEELEAYLAVAPAPNFGDRNFSEPGREDVETASMLSRQDRQVCELTMTDPKDFATFVKASEKEIVPWGDEGKFSKAVVDTYLRPVEGSLVQRFKRRGATGRV